MVALLVKIISKASEGERGRGEVEGGGFFFIFFISIALG